MMNRLLSFLWQRRIYVAAALLLALIFQLFFRYEYVSYQETVPFSLSGSGSSTVSRLMRVDRLTGATCTMPNGCPTLGATLARAIQAVQRPFVEAVQRRAAQALAAQKTQQNAAMALRLVKATDDGRIIGQVQPGFTWDVEAAAPQGDVAPATRFVVSYKDKQHGIASWQWSVDVSSAHVSPPADLTHPAFEMIDGPTFIPPSNCHGEKIKVADSSAKQAMAAGDWQRANVFFIAEYILSDACAELVQGNDRSTLLLGASLASYGAGNAARNGNDINRALHNYHTAFSIEQEIIDEKIGSTEQQQTARAISQVVRAAFTAAGGEIQIAGVHPELAAIMKSIVNAPCDGKQADQMGFNGLAAMQKKDWGHAQTFFRQALQTHLACAKAAKSTARTEYVISAGTDADAAAHVANQAGDTKSETENRTLAIDLLQFALDRGIADSDSLKQVQETLRSERERAAQVAGSARE